MDKKYLFTMPKKLLTDWLAALRSGKYRQGRSILHNHSSDSYCCLGVLQKITDGEVECHSTRYNDHPIAKAMPTQAWCMSHKIEADWRDGARHPMGALANLNDAGNDFNTVADFIEDHVKGV